MDSKNPDSVCFVWCMRTAMSMERYMSIRDKESDGVYIKRPWQLMTIPDGKFCHFFVGTEKEARKLAKIAAAEDGVKWWRLIPMWNKNHLYKGLPAYQDDNIMLIR